MTSTKSLIAGQFRTAVRSLPATSWAVLVSTYLTAVLVAVEAPPLVRVPVALVWTLVVPGLPWARLLRVGDRGDALTVAVAMSLAAAVTVGGLLALAGAWDAATAFRLLVAIAVLGAVVPAVRAAVVPVPNSVPTDLHTADASDAKGADRHDD